jgi:hypothetical protein
MSELIFNVSQLKPEEMSVCMRIGDLLNQMSHLSPKQRRKVYHRLELLHLFTPKMTDLFEENLRRVTKPYET